MGEGVPLVRDGQGGQELLLEIRREGQFQIFDLPGDRVRLPALLPVQKGDPRPVAGRIANGQDMPARSQSGNIPRVIAASRVDDAPEGAGEDDPVQPGDPQAFHHQLGPRIEGGLGQLHAPDVLLADRDLLFQRGLFAPGDDEFRLSRRSAADAACPPPCGNGRCGR